jgi:hypothetical protein
MKRLLSVLVGVCLLQSVAFAQNPPPPPLPAKPPVVPIKPAPPAPPPPPASPASEADRQNIRLELRITDNYSGSPVEKTVSVLMMSGFNGRVRTENVVEAEMGGPGMPTAVTATPIVLNVDAVATALPKDQVSVRVTFEYRPAPRPQAGASVQRTALPATLSESLHIMLRNGQPLVVSQSADPATDRKVTVELTATVLK